MLYKPDSIRHYYLEYMATEECKLQAEQSQVIVTGDEHAFGFVLQEKCNVSLQSNSMRSSGKVLCGETFLIPPDCRCAIDNSSASTAFMLIIRFQCSASVPASGSPLQPFRLVEDFRLYTFRTPQARSWVQDFLGDIGSREPALFYQLQSHLYAMAAALMMIVQKPREMEKSLVEYVEQTRHYIMQHYSEPMDIEDIARLSGASPSRFYQAFRRQTGLSPHKFITKRRLDASLTLLAGSKSSVIEAAHSVGYPDEYYFSRMFKKHLGLTPTEFAARTKKRLACLSPVLRGDLSVLGITPELSLERGWVEQPEIPLKQIRQMEPELILAPPIPNDIHQELIQIAPVIVIPWKKYPWKERLLDISQLFDLQGIAEHWLSYFDMKVENARLHVRQHLGDDPVLLVHAADEHRFRVFGMQMKKMKDLFYDDLQVQPPEPAREIGALDVTSLSDVAAIDCDNILFLVGHAKSEDFCDHLALRWRQLRRSRGKKRCLFIRHDDPLLYNAAAHEGLVDQTVNHLMSKGS